MFVLTVLTPDYPAFAYLFAIPDAYMKLLYYNLPNR